MSLLPAAALAGSNDLAGEAPAGDFWTAASLVGGWAGPRYWPEFQERVTTSGVHPFAIYTGEFFGNVDGGTERGGVWGGILDFGVEMDLETVASLKGGSLFLAGAWIEGDDPTEKLVGNFNAVSNITAFDTLRFLQGWYGQTFGETWTVRAGMLALDDEFMVADAAGLFLNSAFGPLPTQSGNVGAPIWPLSAPGAFVQYEDPAGPFVKFGLYDGDAGEEAVNDDGLRVALNESEGAMTIVESGIVSSLYGYDGAYKVGAFYHSGEFEDFASGRTVNGTSSLYFVADQTLWEAGESRLASFWRVGWSPREDRSVVSSYTDFGFTWEGVGGRSEDAIGVAYSITGFGDDYVDATRAAGADVSRSESVLELIYRATLAPWWILQPDLQWIINPHESRDDALVLGVRTQLIF